MRKLTSFLFMSLDGVVEAPNTYIRSDVFEDILTLIGQTITEQETVLLGRKMYEEWSAYWPTCNIQPFSDFINNVPKFVVSKTLATVDWHRSTVLSGPLDTEVALLKNSQGGPIGVHGSISLVGSLFMAGLLDEMRFILFPVIAGSGRHLLTDYGEAIQLDLTSAQSTPTGLQYLIYHPR